MVQNFFTFKIFPAAVILMLLGMYSASRLQNFSSNETRSSSEAFGKLILILVLGYLLLKWMKSLIKPWMIALIIGLLIFGIYDSYSVRNKLARRMFEDVWQHRSSPDTQKLIDDIQQVFRCCGYNGTPDYDGQALPTSCCADLNCTIDNVFSEGCANVFRNLNLKKL